MMPLIAAIKTGSE